MIMKKLIEPYRGLPGSIYVIFFARMINSLGNFVVPLLTIFLTDRLGYSARKAGFFLMVAALTYALGSVIGGRLCDYFGRKRILVIFQGLAALSFIPCAFIGTSHYVPWLLVASGFFGGAANPSHLAMVMDITNTGNRKHAFALLYLGNNIGLALGPMIAGILYRQYLPWVFVGDALTTLIALTLVTIYIKETKPDKEAISALHKTLNVNERAEEGSLVSVLLRRPILLGFTIIMTILSLVYAQYGFSLPIQVNDIFPFAGPAYYGILFGVNAVTVVLLTPAITAFTMKLKPTFSIFLGAVQYGIGFGMIFFIRSLPLFVFSTVVWTVGEVLINTNSGVYLANNTPISHRGRFNAVLPVIMQTGYAIGPPLAGKLIDAYTVESIWIICFILSISCALLMIGLQSLESFHSKRKKAEL